MHLWIPSGAGNSAFDAIEDTVIVDEQAQDEIIVALILKFQMDMDIDPRLSLIQQRNRHQPIRQPLAECGSVSAMSCSNMISRTQAMYRLDQSLGMFGIDIGQYTVA